MLVFLDFEQSSLRRGSFPIEIGWAVDGGCIESHLIRSDPDWTEWSHLADRVHGIPLEHVIGKGKPLEEVTDQTFAVLGAVGAVVVSDNPMWGQMWLDRLVVAAGLPISIRLADAEKIYISEARRILALAPPAGAPGHWQIVRAQQNEASCLVGDVHCAELQRFRVRHNAGPDAEGMWWILEEVASAPMHASPRGL